MENPIKIDDFEVPPFQQTCICWTDSYTGMLREVNTSLELNPI